MAEIGLSGITKRFGTAAAVDDLTLTVADGGFFVLLGPTGAGKTTTLRLIAGLEVPDGGRVAIGGEDATDWSVAQRDVALVFQYYSLYPRYTVRENLAFPLRSKVRAVPEAEIKRRIDGAAEMLRITHLLDRKTDRLSGGEMQRVSIGRAIVRQPSVFLMDEPLSALDAKLRESLRVELKKLHSELGATFLFVTHDQVEAMSMGDKIGVLQQGRLVQVGTPADIYERPLNTFVARSVGSPPMNLLKGRLSGGMAELGSFRLPITANTAGEGAVTFGVRPENVLLAAGAPGEARVFDIEDQGVVKILLMDMGEARIHVTVPAGTKVQRDELVRFGWKPDRVVTFDVDTGANLALV
jgi:multiple sugar transport system ATP-binding protein